MMELCRFNEHRWAILMLLGCLLYINLSLCLSLNDEGLTLLRFREKVESDPFGALSNWKDEVGIIDPCLWFGVECSEGNVVILNLKNMRLRGTIAPDLRNLIHIKSINLRNNYFYGIIPDEIGELKELEVLDLGYNDFSGPLPSDLGNILSLSIILLDNNEHFGTTSPEMQAFKLLSEAQIDENDLSNAEQRSFFHKRSISFGEMFRRRVQEIGNQPPVQASKVPPARDSPSPAPDSPSSAPDSPSSSPSPFSEPSPLPTSPSSISPPSPFPTGNASTSSRSRNQVIILSTAIVGSALVVILVIGIFLYQSNKVTTIKPWATGLSGQLQKAFVTGLPKLKRSELETACEDFSNVIGTTSIGTVYKGTLSSGIEIAVASLAVTCAKHWSKNLEAQFRKKIATLSKVNHKNFVNLLGFCEEDEPFTRMMVFEYAPNGTLFEHLHVLEAEHLDWGMRMRIAMGMAYCLEHMHQLTPPIAHKNLTSSSVSLTEDYAVKISDFGLWYELPSTEMESNPESNIYSFGIILFEMITGRVPYSVDCRSLHEWASDFLRGQQPIREMVDPTLKSYKADQIERICEVIKCCVHPDPKRRPKMKEVTAILREITTIGPEGAIPKLSPLWWAELEIMSTEGA